MTIEWIHPDELRNHPTNLSIYGDTPDQELIESVRKYGVFPDHPIGYVMDGDFRMIVSGHRRNQAAKIAKQDMVPIVRLTELEGDPLAIEERIILSNSQRVKTNEQKAREASKLASILESRVKVKTTEVDSSTRDNPVPIGTEREIKAQVAEKLHTSERTAQRLISTGKALEDAENKGHKKRARKIKAGLKKSVSAGERASKPSQSSGDSATKKAGTLLQKVGGQIKQVSDNMGPLVRSFDEIKSKDDSFQRKHKELLAHHSRLYELVEKAKDVFKSLKASWDSK